jgi:hypothetical protein
MLLAQSQTDLVFISRMTPFLQLFPVGECASSMSRSPAGVQQRNSMAELLSRTHHPSLLHLIFPAYRTAPEDLSVNASNFSMAHILPV